MERTLVAFTITLAATAPALASHPPQQLTTRGIAGPRNFVAGADRVTPMSSGPGRGFALARQVLPAPSSPFPSGGGAPSSSLRAPARRTIFLNRDGALLRPGDNDARLATSSVVQQPTLLTPWEIDDEMWADTVACVRDLYSRFNVRVTDEDPGDEPHLEAVFGGHPNDVGLPDNVAGVSPFTTDCSIIENSVVFTFTDVLPDDARLMCEVMAQEIAHSFGLDHELLPEDPMTYLNYRGDRAFQDETAACGEDVERPCGIDGHVCWQNQNSVKLLETRLGRAGTGAPDDPAETPNTTTTEPEGAGCSARPTPSGSAGVPLLVALAAGLRRRRRRPPS